MIHIEKHGIQHDGSKQQLMLDFVNLIYTFKDIAKLNEEEIVRLERCFGTMLRQGDIVHITQEFNTEQRNQMITDLYKEVGIKKLENK